MSRRENGVKFRHGCQRAGAADLNGDVLELRLGLFMGVFVGDGETWGLCGRTKLLPLTEIVDLDHRAIDFKWQLRFEFLQFPGSRDDFLHVFTYPPVAMRRETEFLEGFQYFGLFLEFSTLGDRVEDRL